MKIYSILLFLILHCLAFGQSAKKLNKQLQANVLLEEKKQDSVYHLFVEKRRALDEHRKKVNDRMENKFYPEDQELSEKMMTISSYEDAFEILEVDVKRGLPFVSEFADSVPRYWPFLHTYEEPLEKLVLFKFAFEDVFFPKEKEFSERNEILKRLLEMYQVSAKENILQFRELDSFEQKLTELELRLDSLSVTNQLWDRKLLEEKNLLERSYLEAYENYRQNGPKGFSDVYKEYFPKGYHLPPDEEQRRNGERDLEEVRSVVDRSDDEAQSKVNKEAAYPDGYVAMKSYLRYNLVYPAEAKEKGITGRVCVDFEVSETGEITDVSIDRRVVTIVCPECEEEAIRLIKAMPRWIPAVKNGDYVKSRGYEVIWFML